MSAPDAVVLDSEPPEALAANVSVGARLWASAVAFFFMAFVFAFFYLRALNTGHDFQEKGVSPPVGWGVAILACVLLSSAVFGVSRKSIIDGTESAWRLGSSVAFVVSFAAVVLQVIEYYNLKFGATDGGLASVFFVFTAFFGVFWLSAVYWIETLWAQSLRHPRAAESDVTDPGRLLRPSSDGCVVYLSVLCVSEILAFVLLYLVK
jgi:heme/copper-type cytochrome/quinol oxidase subunit 3